MGIKHAEFTEASATPASGTLLAVAGRATQALSDAWQYVKNEGAIRQAIDDLEQLDDHALRDIGINRSEIKSFARHGRIRGHTA